MSCGCEGGATIGSTQRSLEGWVQIGGANRCNEALYAMTGGPLGSGIKVSNSSYSIRGARTPVYRRDGADSSVQCGEREGGRSANKITVDFAPCGCAGKDISDFLNCEELDVYQTEICCDGAGGRFNGGWSKMRIWTGIKFDAAEMQANVSYDQADDGDLVVSYPGYFRDLHTLYPLILEEQTAEIGLGSDVTDVAYPCGVNDCGGSCSCGCACPDCANSWVAITANGRVIYKLGKNSSVTSVLVPNWPAGATDAKVAFWGNYIWAVAKQTDLPDTVFRARCKTPSTWSAYSTGGNTLDISGFICTKKALLAYGQCGLTGTIYDLSSNKNLSSSYCVTDQSCGIPIGGYSAAALCGNNITAVGGCIGDNADEKILTMGGRACEVWAGTSAGTVNISTDSGVTWTAIANITGDILLSVTAIAWANTSVGYIAAQTVSDGYKIYSTHDGGNSWSEERITNLADFNGLLTINKLVVPCCKDNALKNNRFLIAGKVGTRSGVWEAHTAC